MDFIRVVDEVAGETHVIILQATLGENEFQDVATIEVEKAGEGAYSMQVHGNEDIYDVDYYVTPTGVHVHTWPIIAWMYRPHYRHYRSAYYFGYYPAWWRPYRPVSVRVYNTHTVKYTRRTTFAVGHKNRFTVTRVKYKPHHSTLVRKNTVVVRKKGKAVRKRTTVRKRPARR